MPLRKSTEPGYIGIDPGKNGAIVVLCNGLVRYQKMPEDNLELYEALLDIKARFPHATALLERVHTRPGEGRSSVWTFAWGYGSLEMGLTAAGIHYDKVSPQTWIKPLGLPPREKGPKKNSGKTEWKNLLKAKAQEKFKHITVTLWMADALLIADYHRATHGKD